MIEATFAANSKRFQSPSVRLPNSTLLSLSLLSVSLFSLYLSLMPTHSLSHFYISNPLRFPFFFQVYFSILAPFFCSVHLSPKVTCIFLSLLLYPYSILLFLFSTSFIRRSTLNLSSNLSQSFHLFVLALLHFSVYQSLSSFPSPSRHVSLSLFLQSISLQSLQSFHP